MVHSTPTEKPSAPKHQTCRTSPDSLVPNAACAIPFVFRGQVKNGCIDDLDPNRRLWCPTELDDELKPVSDKWGYCETCTSR